MASEQPLGKGFREGERRKSPNPGIWGHAADPLRLHDRRQVGLSGVLGRFAGLVGAGDGARRWPKRAAQGSETAARGLGWPRMAKP